MSSLRSQLPSSLPLLSFPLPYQVWSQDLEDKANASQPKDKAEKEKLKKLQSKARNTLRKLLRLSSTLGHGSGEYGVVSEADVEVCFVLYVFMHFISCSVFCMREFVSHFCCLFSPFF